MRLVAFHPEARAELAGAVAYYDTRAAGLGGDLAAEVEQAVALLAADPEIGTPVGRSLRKWRVVGSPSASSTPPIPTGCTCWPLPINGDGRATGRTARELSEAGCGLRREG